MEEGGGRRERGRAEGWRRKGEEGGVERREGEQMRADREGFRDTNSN
jgi:hypothetical protein